MIENQIKLINSFNKEQLKILFFAINVVLINNSIDKKKERSIAIELSDTLKNMIDNYCEHKNIYQKSDVDYIRICINCQQITDYL